MYRPRLKKVLLDHHFGRNLYTFSAMETFLEEQALAVLVEIPSQVGSLAADNLVYLIHETPKKEGF